MRTKIYLSGKITGDPDYARKFREAGNLLNEAGYEPLNPAAIVLEKEGWQNAMKQAVRLMLLGDGVALLPGWKKSRGAKIEAALAKAIGMPAKPVEEWLKGNELKPCPFCGEIQKIIEHCDFKGKKTYYINHICGIGRSTSAGTAMFEIKEEVIAAWNKRIPEGRK